MNRSPGRITAIALLAAVLVPVGSPSRGSVLLVPEQYSTIQAAVDTATGLTDTISVAPGTYTGLGNRDIVIQSKCVYIQSRAGASETVIDCQHAGRAFYLLDAFNLRSIIDGFTIINGNATHGGAIFTEGTDITVRHSILMSNDGYSGGAVYTTIRATFEDCWFIGNYASRLDGGGAVYALQAPNIFERCVFIGNETPGDGGAVLGMAVSEFVFTECTIVANVSGRGGGGIYSFDSNVRLDRSNCRGNCASLGDEIYVQAPSRGVALECSNVNLAGVVTQHLTLDRTIDLDARFCDPRPCGSAVGDYHLRSDSPCLPDGNPCGVLIGALDMGCQAPGIGACCLSDTTCILTTSEECSALQGTFLGVGTLCLPGSCAPSPVERVTWGRVKATFR